MAHTHPSVTYEHSLNGEKLALLAVLARPEDESFGPAGTLAKYANEGVQVSLVIATSHAAAASEPTGADAPARDRLCSCRASGIRRACWFDYRTGELARVAQDTLEEQIVRLIRELCPQVIVTFGADWLRGESDYRILSAATFAAFRDAGDPAKFPRHAREGLSPYAPQKLYQCVLPQSLVARWGMSDWAAVPDDRITTVLDVSAQSEVVKSAWYCQRHGALDFVRRAIEHQIEWNTEYYVLVESRLRRRTRRENDLFAGLR